MGKRSLMYVGARNLGVVMRALFHMGSPRSLPSEGEASPCAGEVSCRAALGCLAIVPPRLRGLFGSSVPSPGEAINRSAFARTRYAA